MNNQRRKELQKALDFIEQAKEIIEACHGDEQDAFDNMPEGLQSSEKGEMMSEKIDLMDSIISELESQIEEIQKVIE